MTLPLANVSLTNTFDQWRIRGNEVIYRLNEITAQTANSAGAVYGEYSNLTVDSTLTLGANVVVTFANTVNMGTVSNIHITGGSNGQVLKTDGSGNLSFGGVAFSSLTGSIANSQFQAINSLGRAQVNAGNTTTPSVYMSTDTTTGQYRSAANEVAWTVSGTQRFKITSVGATVNGTLAATALTGDGSGITGIATAASAIAYAIALG